MACQPPSQLQDLDSVQKHFSSEHSVPDLLSSRATRVVALPFSLSCHSLSCTLPHKCLLCQPNGGEDLPDERLKEHMVEKHGKFFLENWQQFCTFHCRLCGTDVTCEEREHRTNCALQCLRWWAATNQQLNKEINDGAFMNKQEEYYLGRNVEKLMASDVVCSKVEVKEEVKPKGEQADNVGNKVDQGKQTGRGEQNLLTDQLRGNDQVKSVAKLQRGKILNRGKNPNKEERNRGRESDEAKDRRMVMNDQGEVGVQMNMANKKAFGDAKKGELSINQGNVEKMEKLKQENEQTWKRHYSDDEEKEEEIGFLVMADCIQHDEGQSAPPPAKACSKTYADRQQTSKKASSKLIKSVIDIDDDGSSRSRIHHQENPNLLVDIKTVRVKKVVRKTSVTKEAPVCIKKEKEVESPGLPNLVAKLPDSGNQPKKEDLRNLTTVTLSMKKFEAIRLIGQQGKNIKELEQKTGAKIIVTPGKGDVRTVKIHGNIEIVAKAKAEVEKYFFSNCNTKVKVSEKVARALYANKAKLLCDIKSDCKVYIAGIYNVFYLFGSEKDEKKAKARLEELANPFVKEIANT